MAASNPFVRIAGLMSKGTPDEALAAATVLGAVAPKEKGVVDALGAALRSDQLPLALAAARALGRIGNPAALKALLPLLEAEGELRETGALAIAGCGKAALPAVKKALAAADLDARRVLFGILAEMGTVESWSLVMDAFLDDNFEAVKAAGWALRNAVPRLSEAARAATVKRTLAFLKERPTTSSRSGVNSALILLGHLARPEAIPVLLDHATPDNLRATRRHALTSLRHCLRGEGAAPAAVERLFPGLDDPNFEDVVEPTLAVLGRSDIPKKLEPELLRHVGGRHIDVRQFAIRKLAESTSAQAAEKLLELIGGDDERLRQSAVHALKRSPKAPALLLPLLLKEKDAERAWSFVHLMKPHAAELTAADRKRIADAALKALDKGEKRAEPLMHLYRATDEAGYLKGFLARAAKAKKAGKPADAVRALRMIERSQGFDSDARFQLAVCALKASLAAKGNPGRERDEALGMLLSLAGASGFDLAKRLRAESRFLGPDGLCAVGFRFAEAPGAARALGATLLRDLAKKSPGSKAGKTAKAKLATEGLK